MPFRMRMESCVGIRDREWGIIEIESEEKVFKLGIRDSTRITMLSYDKVITYSTVLSVPKRLPACPEGNSSEKRIQHRIRHIPDALE
jgi:hypothetical protein